GRLFNLAPTATGKWVNLRNATAVTFVCVGADTYTLQEASDVSGTGARNLAGIRDYYESAAADGTAPWTRSKQPDSHQLTTDAAVAVFSIPVARLSKGYTHLAVTADDSGAVTAIVHDMVVHRPIERQPAVVS